MNYAEFIAGKVRKTAAKRILITCEVCRTVKSRTPTQVAHAKTGHHFCSQSCHYKGRILGIIAQIKRKKYHYSPEEKARQRARGAAFKGTRRVYHFVKCTQCGKTFDDKRHERPRKLGAGIFFCSQLCSHIYRSGPNNHRWVGGRVPYYGPDWRRIRKAARKRDGNTCCRCHKKARNRAHDVHHLKAVNTFAEPNDANTMDNVVTLCAPCHRAVEDRGIDFKLPKGTHE